MLRQITTVLDLLGMLALVVAAALFVAQWTLSGAIATGGVGLLVGSWVIDAAGARGRSRR